MSVRPEIAANLHSIQSKLGDSLGGVLEEETAAPTANFRQTMVLEHIGGLQSGGALPLATGSYRFGRSSNAVLLDNGKTHDPQFGLTVDPEGSVTLYPPAAGVLLDGEVVTEPSPMSVGQVVTVGHNRFGLKPQARLAVSRTSTAGDAGEPMPAPARGRSVDMNVIDWVQDQRERALRALWLGHVSPVEIHRRITENSLFQTGAEDQGFGQLLLGTTDLPFDAPDELSATNKATQEEVAEWYATLPGAPVAVDLNHTSLAIAGPGDHARAVATWLLLSLATRTSPADLGIVAQTSAKAGAWSWLDRLPHLGSPSPTLTVALVDEQWPGGDVASGAIALFDSPTLVPREFGAVLCVQPAAATFVDHLADGVERDVTVIGIANAVAVERSLVIGQHLDAMEDGAWG